MKVTYKTLGGAVNRLCLDILKQPHTLIAGATGSGKSVLINSLIYTVLHYLPTQNKLILIDPKRVELQAYKNLPHTLLYASEPPEITKAIYFAIEEMERRYKLLQAQNKKRYEGAEVYVIVDEFADLMTVQKNEVLKPLCRIAQLGRAAGIHLILATQRPTRDIINGQIKVNIDSRIALRCPTAQDSRNIINYKGAELLPKYGHGYYLTPDTGRPVLVEIPYTPDQELQRIINHWIAQQPKRRNWLFWK